MAGGVKKPVNIFRLGQSGEPKSIFNWRLWFAVMSFGLLGAARGIDEGLISGCFESKAFKQLINFSQYSEVEQANIKGNVSSMVLIGSVPGSLFAFLICDRIGRLWATRQLCFWWALGIAIFMGCRGSLSAVYAGRFIAGFGIGQTPVVGPIYVAEIAPSSIRGLCTCVFTGMVYFGVNLAYWSNFGASKTWTTEPQRWLVPTSLHLMFAVLICILSFFQVESPRYLIKRGKTEKATKVMSRLRQLPPDDPYIRNEIAMIQASHDAELEATRGMSLWQAIKKSFTSKPILYRLYLVTSIQFLSQWTGTGSITIYAPDFFDILGIRGETEGLLVSAVFALVKLGAAVICCLFLVDVIGRKRSLLVGITLQSISMIYVAAFLTHVPKLGIDDSFHLPESLKGVSRGAVAMIYLAGFGWALGWNSMQYLLSAELFPLRIRAIGQSWAMALHFANQYGNARAVPNLLLPTNKGGITPSGTFWSFAAVTIIGGVWVWFFVPESAGRSLEDIDRLFELPWYKIGRYGNRAADDADEAARNEELEEDKLEKEQAEAEYYENQNDKKPTIA